MPLSHQFTTTPTSSTVYRSPSLSHIFSFQTHTHPTTTTISSYPNRNFQATTTTGFNPNAIPGHHPKMTWDCSKCHSTNGEDDDYCRSCGHLGDNCFGCTAYA